MTTWPESMPALAERVSLVPVNRTVGEVVDRLTAIEQELDGFFSPAAGSPAARRDRPPLPDGVACFNGMYLQVTEAVRDELPAFESPEFVERLDVLFAEFYFQAFDAAAAQAWVSKAWAPLFDAPRRARHPRPPVRDRGHERPHQQRPRARAGADLAASSTSSRRATAPSSATTRRSTRSSSASRPTSRARWPTT